MTTSTVPLLGHQAKLRAAFSRLATGQSAAIVGEPNTGKSLLLAHVASPEVRAKWLPHPERLAIITLDGRELPADFKPVAFWGHVFETLQARAPPSFRDEVPEFARMTFSPFTLERFFRQLARAQMRVALLVDHFGHFLSRPALATAELLGTLRSLSSRSGGLALLVTGRRRVSEMNQQTAQLNPRGSPYFNTLQEIRLGAFSRDEARKVLLDHFDADNASLVQTVTGRHPYLISLTTRTRPPTTDAPALATALTPQAARHFDLAYRFLGDLAPVLLSTLGRQPLLRPPTPGDIEDLIWRGWLERDPDGTLRPASLLLERWLEDRQPGA